jgi:hypothetical protein
MRIFFIATMAEPGAAAQQVQGAARGIASVKLSPFWAASPANWFLQAEAQFAVRDNMNPIDRHYLVMAALTEPQIDLVSNILSFFIYLFTTKYLAYNDFFYIL